MFSAAQSGTERAFIEAGVAQDVRADGRGRADYRCVSGGACGWKMEGSAAAAASHPHVVAVAVVCDSRRPARSIDHLTPRLPIYPPTYINHPKQTKQTNTQGDLGGGGRAPGRQRLGARGAGAGRHGGAGGRQGTFFAAVSVSSRPFMSSHLMHLMQCNHSTMAMPC